MVAPQERSPDAPSSSAGVPTPGDRAGPGEGQADRRAAHDLGISESCLRNLVARADIDEGRRDGVTSADRAELADLRRKLRVAEMANEILRRAAAYFARENVLPK